MIKGKLDVLLINCLIVKFDTYHIPIKAKINQVHVGKTYMPISWG